MSKNIGDTIITLFVGSLVLMGFMLIVFLLANMLVGVQTAPAIVIGAVFFFVAYLAGRVVLTKEERKDENDIR